MPRIRQSHGLWSTAQVRPRSTAQDLLLQLPTVQLQPGPLPMTAAVLLDHLIITISGQVIPVTGITVTGTGGATTITTDNGTLQLTATVTPSDATNKTVTWSMVNGTGQATINSAQDL